MKKSCAKYKPGDRVIVSHIGECEVKSAVAIDGGFEYILSRGDDAALFSVAGGDIEGLVSDEEARC